MLPVPEKPPIGRALGNQYALHALRERRAEITGEIITLESRLRSLRTSLGYLDGSLAVMAPGFDPASIKPTRPRKAKLFGKGKLNAMILDALRRADRPLHTSEVTAAVAKAMKFGPEAEAGLKNRVRANLLYLAKVRGTVRKEGEREAARWSIGLSLDSDKAPSAPSLARLA